jgi:hypothetical protein
MEVDHQDRQTSAWTLGVARQLDGFVVRRARLLSAAQPAQQVCMVGVIVGQLVLKTVDGRQCHLCAIKLGDRDGPVEGR